MFIFSDMKFLYIFFVMNNVRYKGEMVYIMVQNYMNFFENVFNNVFFSWRIKDYLEELWVQVQYIIDVEGLLKKFVDIFQQIFLGRFFVQFYGELQQEFFQCYLKDFIFLIMYVVMEEELEFLQMVLWFCIRELKVVLEVFEEEVFLLWVYFVYQCFRSWLQNFFRILIIYFQVFYSLMEVFWNYELVGCEMILDVFVVMVCMEMLMRDILKFSFQVWLQLVKNFFMLLEFICFDGYM